MVKIGRIYTLHTKKRVVATVKVLSYNPVDKMHKVARVSNMEIHTNENLKKYTLTPSNRKPKLEIYIYMCDIGNGFYKLGVSHSPMARCKQIKTYAPRAKMVVFHKIPLTDSSNWKKYEAKLFSNFNSVLTGGKEVFQFNKNQAEKCKSLIRSICTSKETIV